MYKKQKRNLKAFLNLNVYNDDVFSRSTMNTIIRALLEPVVNHNASSLLFTRIKNKEGLDGLIKRLEYCTNIEMVDTLTPDVLKKDDYVELEFIIFTSARYNFALIWDYSGDRDKNYTKGFFLANSRSVNDVYEILQENMRYDYREKFYLHKPERRDNELLNEAMFNVFKKLNNSIEEGGFDSDGDLVVDFEDDENEEKIKEISHEIKNELSIIDVYTSILEKETGKNKHIDVIKRAASVIIFQLNRLKQYESKEIEEVSIMELLSEAIQMTEGMLVLNNNTLKLTNKEKYDLKIFGNYYKLLSAVLNIIKNANEAAQGDEIEVNVSLNDNLIYTDIINHGAMIDPNDKKHLFDKGYTTKHKGSGLGLYACKKYLKEMGGDVILLNSNKDETVFRISLPSI